MSSTGTRVWRDIKQVWIMADGELVLLECGHSVRHNGRFPSGRCEVSGVGLTRAWCPTCERDREIERLRNALALVPKHCPHACLPSCPFDRAMAAFRGALPITEERGEKR